MVGQCSLSVLLASALLLAATSACGRDAASSKRAQDGSDSAAVLVGYDIRRLRPVSAQSLSEMFARVFDQAIADGKQVAVLFSAEWCEACRALTLELGNMHPEEAIGHVRIVEIREEDWEPATRMDEFNALRSRWYPVLQTYPLFVMLGADGKRVEEMREAKDRLEAMGAEATIPNWFQSLPAR